MKNKLDLDNLPNLLTIQETADLFRVSKLTLKRWGREGKLPAIRINDRGDRRYFRKTILEHLESYQNQVE